MFDAVHHIAYVVHDRDAALSLFSEKLGMKPFKIWESDEEGNAYAALQIGNTDSYLEIICPTNDTVSKFAAHLKEHGASVHHVAFRDQKQGDRGARRTRQCRRGGRGKPGDQAAA